MPAAWLLPWLFAMLPVWIQGQPESTYLQKTRSFHTAEEFARMTGGKAALQRNLDPRQETMLRTGAPLPVSSLTVIAVESPSTTWIGTQQGAIRVSRDGQQREYFYGRRWLPDDHVTGIGFDGTATWLETPQGFARIEDPADNSGGQIPRLRRTRAGAAQPLGIDRRIASPRGRRPVDESDGVERQRRALDSDVCSVGGVPVQGHGGRRRPGERAAWHAGDRAARIDYRITGVSCPLVHQDRRRGSAQPRRVARHRRQGVAMERRHEL